jgi:threonine aldolase
MEFFMIDLRSDTLTKPTEEMRNAMHAAEVGDEGRAGADGRGEDPTIRKLEDMAAELMGKEAAMYVPSGTMGNLTALMTFCSAGQHIAVEKKLHVYHNEKCAFMDRPGGLIPEFYETDGEHAPVSNSIKGLLESRKIDLLCLENTHNFAGGTCLSKEQMDTICLLAKKNHIPVHLDGARVNNAAIFLNIPVNKLVGSVDTVMFCLSKGLGAPVGSMLCGGHDFIFEARKIRKFLGGTMRQAGMVAAAGIVAIQRERERLAEDHKNALLLAERIEHNRGITIDRKSVQTNMVRVDVFPSGYGASYFRQGLEKRGLKSLAISDTFIRMVTYREISRKDVMAASDIFNAFCESL